MPITYYNKLKATENVESMGMWCWTRTEISWTDRMENKEVLTVKEGRNIAHIVKKER
jgi:hypothetical protein